MAHNNQNCLKKVEIMGQRIDWMIEKERRQLISQFHPLFKDETCQLPNIQEIFRPEQMECLLSDCIRLLSNYRSSREEKQNAVKFVKFVARSGYKVKPEVGKDGKPWSRRTTPIHLAVNITDWKSVEDLFTIYESFVDYVDEFGYNHFHVACKAGWVEAVQRYLDFGLDPNCLVSKTGDSSLHLALRFDQDEVLEVLLRNGSDPNLANGEGLTPLHEMCIKDYDSGMAEFFFEINDDLQQVLHVDSKDKLGRTPLQLAVQTLQPDVVDLLIDHGADLARFVFPDNIYLSDADQRLKYCDATLLELASNALIMIDRLEDRGYELDRSDALTIMTYFAKLKFFEKSTDLAEHWDDDEEFTSRAKEIKIKDEEGPTLYDLMELRPEEVAKSFTYQDYFELAKSYKFMEFPEVSYMQACTLNLFEKLARGFLRPWATIFYYEMIQYRIPIECCELVLEDFTNADLWRLCLAATGQNEGSIV